MLALVAGSLTVTLIFVFLRKLASAARDLQDMGKFLSPALATTMEELEYEFTKLQEYKANPAVQAMIDRVEPSTAVQLRELVRLQVDSSPEDLDRSAAARELENLLDSTRAFRLAL